MFNRIGGVFRLDSYTFEEIESDPNATGQAALVVIVVALIAAVGSGFGALIFDGEFFSSFVSQLLTVLVGWVVWSVVTWFVGVNLFGGQADVGEMLRVIGFAYAPQVLAIIPCIGWPIGIIWSVVAGFIAVRQGLDLDNTKTFLTIIVGIIGYIVVMFVFNSILGTTETLFGSLFN
jgi:uncharacterized membrane protein YeaQ/YmgE (transglycosylase-associated protein family)